MDGIFPEWISNHLRISSKGGKGEHNLGIYIKSMKSGRLLSLPLPLLRKRTKRILFTRNLSEQFAPFVLKPVEKVLYNYIRIDASTRSPLDPC